MDKKSKSHSMYLYLSDLIAYMPLQSQAPTDEPMRCIRRFIPNDIPLYRFGVEVNTTFTEPICVRANPTATITRTAAIEVSVK